MAITTLGDNFRVIIEGGAGARFAGLAEASANASTIDADRAESARDIAQAAVGVDYADATAALAGAVNGDKFTYWDGDEIIYSTKTGGVLVELVGPWIGADKVGADDGHSGSWFTTVQGFITRLLSSVGSSVVGFIQSGVGAIARSVQSKLSDTISVKDFGAVGDGVTDDTVALNAALTAAVAANRCLYFPTGVYLVTANITVPTPSSVQRGFTIRGEGKHYGSIIRFSGAAVTTGLTFASGVGVYQYWGTISEIQIECVSGAKRGITFNYAHAPLISNVQFNGGTEPALVLQNCNQPVVKDCMFRNSGSSGTAQLWLNNSTAFTLRDNYIASGGAGCAAGIDIDRTNTGLIIGGAIESSGVPIRIAEATEGALGCGDITIQSINMENPTNCYIRMGYGWTSTYGVKNILILGCRGYTSGSTTALIGVDMKHSLDVDVIGCQFGLNAGATASHNLFGTTNAGVFIGKSRGSFGNPVPWVKVNSSQDVTAGPLTDWCSDFSTNQIIYAARSGTTSTLNNQILAAQGGLYNSITLINAAPTTINRTAAIPSVSGTNITIRADDGNTTIAHLGGGGTGQFQNKSGAAIAMTSGRAITYVYNGSTGNWSEI